MKNTVKIEDDNIVIIYAGKNEYNIQLSKCDNDEKIADWIKHLNDKTWCDQQTIDDFVRLSKKKNNLG